MRQMGEGTVDGLKYEVGHWPVDKATGMLTKLIKILGEPLAMVIVGAVGNKKDGESIMDADLSALKGESISKAFAGLSTRLDEHEVQKMLKEINEGILCDGKRIDYNTHYMGRIGHLFRVSMFVLKHQYSDFLVGNPAQGD